MHIYRLPMPRVSSRQENKVLEGTTSRGKERYMKRVYINAVRFVTQWSPTEASSLHAALHRPCLPMTNLNSPTWRLIESFYGFLAPNPPPRVRDTSRPMQVICVGLPRSGTESLQKALLMLGYDYTYHVCGKITHVLRSF